MSPPRPRLDRLDRLDRVDGGLSDHELADHRRAVEELVARVRSVSAAAWRVPRGAGAWSPAQEAAHVALSYAAFARALAGELHPAPAVRAWKAMLLRWLVLPRILRGGWFPTGARAPHATWPPAEPPDQPVLVAELMDHADTLMRALRAAGADRRVHHPYFGALSARQVLGLSAAHTRHHARRLAGPEGR